jgi:small subunit ribosomal protein S6
MKKYEAMFILRPDISEEDRKTLFNQIGEVITKHQGNVISAAVWAERKKLYFTLKKFGEGLYYLVTFTILPAAIKDIRHAYQLNEGILRLLISNIE